MFAMALLIGCSSRGAEPTPPKPSAPVHHEPAPSASPSVSPDPSRAEPTLLITEPSVLARLEARGLSLGALFSAPGNDNLALAAQPNFAPLVRELTREVDQVAAADKLAGVDVARFSHRLFDKRFLRLRHAWFALAGVVNRPDRAPFAPASCGETRLIYRLQYELEDGRASKLPMTLGVELTVPRGDDGCRAAAERWQEPSKRDADERAAWLRSDAGPLSPSLTALRHERAQVVVNMQLVRWPSTVRPDLGGHAEYLLRAFRPDSDGVLEVEPLENTIAPQARPMRWLAENFAAVDAGTAVLPAQFLATRALSVTPRGLQRLANRPFSQALPKEPSLSTLRGTFVKSPEALGRRVDELSCPGCHQARSVAGFHLLGEDAAGAPAENALSLPVSPQVIADLPRRLRVARQMLAGEEPSFAAPFAERAGEPGLYGDACSLGKDPSFASWTCAPGLACSALEASESDALGRCVPTRTEVGDACERASMVPSANRLRDRMTRVRVEACPNMVCNRSGVGFPGGMCTAACEAPGSSCGAIAILEPFNACLARGESFLSCIRGNVQPAGLRSCSAESPCRDDYVCARGKAGGVCLPPYFVFQLRVDGHSVGSAH
jgi:hypothetical protein